MDQLTRYVIKNLGVYHIQKSILNIIDTFKNLNILMEKKVESLIRHLYFAIFRC